MALLHSFGFGDGLGADEAGIFKAGKGLYRDTVERQVVVGRQGLSPWGGLASIVLR
jgi:hypothetical protein